MDKRVRVRVKVNAKPDAKIFALDSYIDDEAVKQLNVCLEFLQSPSLIKPLKERFIDVCLS